MSSNKGSIFSFPSVHRRLDSDTGCWLALKNPEPLSVAPGDHLPWCCLGGFGLDLRGGSQKTKANEMGSLLCGAQGLAE